MDDRLGFTNPHGHIRFLMVLFHAPSRSVKSSSTLIKSSAGSVCEIKGISS